MQIGSVQVPEWVRSAVLTFLTMFIITILAEDFTWAWSALGAAAVAALRTAASGFLPGGSFGTKPSIEQE